MSLPSSFSCFRISARLTTTLIAGAIVLMLATAGSLAQRTRKVSGGSAGSASGTSKAARDKKTTSRGFNRSQNLQDPITGETAGIRIGGEAGVQRTTAEIIEAQSGPFRNLTKR